MRLKAKKLNSFYKYIKRQINVKNFFYSYIVLYLQNGNEPEDKYSAMDRDKNLTNIHVRALNDTNDVYKNNLEAIRNIYSSQNQRKLDGDSNVGGVSDQRTRNRSYDMTREKVRNGEKQRKYSLDNRSILDEGKEEPQSKSERINQLRAKHQKKHVERRGQYPLEEKEEKFEQTLQLVC